MGIWRQPSTYSFPLIWSRLYLKWKKCVVLDLTSQSHYYWHQVLSLKKWSWCISVFSGYCLTYYQPFIGLSKDLPRLPVYTPLYRELHFKAETYWSVVIAVSLQSLVKLMVWYYHHHPPPPLPLTLCQPIRRYCTVWRSSMRCCRAGTVTPRLREASRSYRRTPRNMFTLLRSMWECLVWVHRHAQSLIHRIHFNSLTWLYQKYIIC